MEKFGVGGRPGFSGALRSGVVILIRFCILGHFKIALHSGDYNADSPSWRGRVKVAFPVFLLS